MVMTRTGSPWSTSGAAGDIRLSLFAREASLFR